MFRSFVLTALAAGAIASPANTAPYASCKDVNFTVSGSAFNLDIRNVNLSDTASLLSQIQGLTLLPFLTSGSQNLAGTFCDPYVKNGNINTIQVLYASLSSNRDSWSALGGTSLGYPQYNPQLYSYVDYMNALGYPTLALDRLGNGKSSHPDPILVVQSNYEDVLYHDLATQVRAGTSGQLPRKFSKLIWVGNSLGSELGSTGASKFPNDWDTYILTGFSKSVDPSLPGVALGQAAPAAVVMPDRFGNLAPGYLTTSSEQGRTNSFFGSHEQADYEDQVAHLFYTREDVVSAGQFISAYIGPVVAPKYTGRVLVLTGEQDQAFCGPGSPVIGPAHCGNLLNETGTLFPAADYNWKSVNRTGHAIQLHKTAQKTYGIAAAFLAGASFKGGPPA